MNTDNVLMQLVKEGHTSKLGLLFERYKNPLFGYFYRNTGGQVYSEDLVQNVFWRILKYKHTFDEQKEFKTWLYQIAHRVLIDSWRKKKTGTAAISEDIDNGSINADEALIEDETLKILRTALCHLQPDQREVLIMSKYQNLKYKDIAEIMDCTEGAVKVRIFRALQELKSIYKYLEGR